jgi:hypothetical protein
MDNTEKKVEVELTAAQKLAQMEKEKLTRRQALARFGFQAGAAAVAALTADELLRKVGKDMQRRAGDNKVAQQVAKELSNAGVVSAAAATPFCENKPSGLAGCLGADTGPYCRSHNGNISDCRKCCEDMYAMPTLVPPALGGPCCEFLSNRVGICQSSCFY